MYVFGVSWDDSKKPRAVAILLACALLLGVAVSPGARAARAPSRPDFVSVIVRETRGAGSTAKNAVARLGGRLGARLAVINGFVARVPRSAVDDLRAAAGVLSVTGDARVELHHTVHGFDAEAHPGSMFNTARTVGADVMWSRGFIGSGVDIALIDSGVAPVVGLTRPGKIVNGPDLSFESQAENLRYLDTFGHGTHMAGIMAGRDPNFPEAELETNHDKFAGIAPGARVVSLKVADALGNTDVSQVIAAIDWVVENRNKYGLNIRVLNLSFGTDGVQPAALDPLSYAAEVAWRRGIVVVVAAGNRGYGTPRLNNPAYNPFVIAVGSADTNGTEDVADDVVSNFSSRGTEGRNVDVLAPGRSVVSLRDPGSFVDANFPSAQAGPRFFKGSGTSQAAAVVSGAAALILEQRPEITPDELKGLLMSTAKRSPNGGIGQGEGLISLRRARWTSAPTSSQTHDPGSGLGTLEGARGTLRLFHEGVGLEGEQDIFGTAWNPGMWAPKSLNQQAWVGGQWNGLPWTGGAMDATSWAGPAWDAVAWTRNSWAGDAWNMDAWSKNSWSGSGWTNEAWARNSWSGDEWAKNSWSGGGWLGDYWVENRSPSGSDYKNSWSGGDWSILECFGIQTFKNSWSGADWAESESFGTQVYKNSWSGADWSEVESFGSKVFKNSWSSGDWSGAGCFGGETFKNSWSGVDWAESESFGTQMFKNSWSGVDWAESESFGTQVFKNSWSGADWSEVESFGSKVFKNSWSSSAWE